MREAGFGLFGVKESRDDCEDSEGLCCRVIGLAFELILDEGEE